MINSMNNSFIKYQAKLDNKLRGVQINQLSGVHDSCSPNAWKGDSPDEDSDQLLIAL